MLELKIGSFPEHSQVLEEEFGEWRFVITKDKVGLFLYASAVARGKKCGHISVCAQYNLDNIQKLGGGDILYSYGTLKFMGMSGDFGIVPNSCAEGFAKLIFEDYKEKCNILKVSVNMWYDPGVSEEKNPHHINMWNNLGYQFDNKKIEFS